MTKIRKQHSKHLKFKASIELLKSEKTLSQLCQEYGIHQSVLQRWKKTLMDEGAEIFEDHRQKKTSAPDKTQEFERKIGQLTMEVDFLKKALGQ
jgi:transposase-like protein